MAINKKPPVYDDPCMPWLMRLSKAALADCVVDLLRPAIGSIDNPVRESAAIERLESVLRQRGDKTPEGQRRRVQQRRNKRVFEQALRIAEGDCASCLGHGHFREDGSATDDRRERKCGDCRGTGKQ